MADTDQKRPMAAAHQATPKKKSRIGIILGIIALLVTLPVGVYVLSQQNQQVAELRSKAAAPSGKSSCTGCSPDGFEWKWHSLTSKCSKSAIKCGGGGGSATTTKVACGSAGAVQCGRTPDGCGGFCIKPVDKTCDDMLRQECHFEPVRGANYVALTGGSCPSGFQSAQCNCNGTQICFDRGFSNQCNTADGLCAVYNNSQTSGGAGGRACGTQLIYQCDPKVDLSGQKSCDTSTGGKSISKIPSCFCGTIQVDTACQGFKTYKGTCGCSGSTSQTNSPTPTSTPTGTPTSTPTPTTPNTPTPTPTGTPGPTNTPGPTSTPTPTSPFTPTPTRVVAAVRPRVTGTPSPIPTPKLPVSGVPSVLGISVVAGGAILLMLGLVL